MSSAWPLPFETFTYSSMNDWSCGLSVKRQATIASLCFVANSCQNASSAIGRPSPFEPGTSTSVASSVAAPVGTHSRNSALS